MKLLRELVGNLRLGDNGGKIMTEVQVKCKCGRDGWLDVKEEKYKSKCGDCSRIYTVYTNGLIKINNNFLYKIYKFLKHKNTI